MHSSGVIWSVIEELSLQLCVQLLHVLQMPLAQNTATVIALLQMLVLSPNIFFYQVVNMPLCYQLSDTLVITMSSLWYASRHHVYELEEALVLYGQTQGLAM